MFIIWITKLKLTLTLLERILPLVLALNYCSTIHKIFNFSTVLCIALNRESIYEKVEISVKKTSIFIKKFSLSSE